MEWREPFWEGLNVAQSSLLVPEMWSAIRAFPSIHTGKCFRMTNAQSQYWEQISHPILEEELEKAKIDRSHFADINYRGLS